MINIIAPSRYKLNKKSIRTETEQVVEKQYRIKHNYQLNIVFVGVRKVKAIAKHFKKSPQAHPVLTLSYVDEQRTDSENLLGEIIICYPQAVLLAAQKEKTVDQMINYLINHGLENIFS